MTTKQRKEVQVWEYFVPSNCQWAAKIDADVTKFFEWSEHGLHKSDAAINTFLPEGRTYFHALVWGKKRAMIHAHELWGKDVLVPWFEILEELPPVVAEWVRKERNLTDEAIAMNALAMLVSMPA